MPPKSKFTKEEIIAAALEIAAESGIEAVTARAVGERLGSSARPVFTVFQNMEEVISEVTNAAKKLYNRYIQDGLTEEIRFKGVGKQYIKFAMEQPKLFQLLFMSEQRSTSDVKSISVFDENYEDILSSITDMYGLDKETALSLYWHMWIYTHGIAALCATNTLKFSGEEVSDLMTDVFKSLLINKISERNKKNNDQA